MYHADQIKLYQELYAYAITDIHGALKSLYDDINATHSRALDLQREFNNMSTVPEVLQGIGYGVVKEIGQHAVALERSAVVFTTTAFLAYACLDTWGPFTLQGNILASASVGFSLARCAI